jgi:L-aspartate oxidase
MIRSSREIIDDLIGFGVEFEQENGELCYTREGAHSRKRILFHEDVTGKEITSKLLKEVQKRDNVTIVEKCTMIDLLCENNSCYGAVVRLGDRITCVEADYTILACGGIGGLFEHSTNYAHLTGDALAIALKHGIELKNINYIQIHPTTLYTEKKERSFLISESVRGEGAVLYNKNMERFVDELLPRDVVAQAIFQQMEKDGMPYVWLSMENIPEDEIRNHFPNIYNRCLEEGFDVTKECIPVVPAQHYFMGGIKVDLMSRTSMERLYAAGETSCNGVHGANRLASNSLLETLVFAKRAAKDIMKGYDMTELHPVSIDEQLYEKKEQLASEYKTMILKEIERMDTIHV